MTQDNHQELDDDILERFDQFVATNDWINHYEKRCVFHMEYWGFDHRVIFLILDPKNNVDMEGRKKK